MRRLYSSLLLSLVIASSASAVTMAWTPIGNPGNGCQLNNNGYGGQGCYGAVAYQYSIGTYEVTNAQYAEFLNAKAASDPLGLYNTVMDPSFGDFGGIIRSGSSGSYSYSTTVARANMPVNNVTFFDALRFANWMNNGQGNGDTETGAYTLLGGTETPSNRNTVARNPGATIVLTSEDEWYKAAYYDAVSTSYFAYPAGSNAQIICATPTTAANRGNCNYAVADLTPVGSYTGSASAYGTYDQGGNVYEWNEARNTSVGFRGNRGGCFCSSSTPSQQAAAFRNENDPTIHVAGLGFRVAMIPEPDIGLLVIAGLLGLAGWRRVHAPRR